VKESRVIKGKYKLKHVFFSCRSETADSTTTSTSSSQTSSTKDPDSKDSAVSVGLSFFVLFTTLYFAISNTV
jgi:hypothetical protein